MKISTFVIAIVLVGAIVTGMGMYISEISGNYAQTFDQGTLAGLDKTADVQNLTQDIYDDLSGIDTTSSTLDLVGGFLKSGYTVIKVTFASFGIFTDMSTTAFSRVPVLSVFGSYLFVIAFIAFVFIVISILVGRDT